MLLVAANGLYNTKIAHAYGGDVHQQLMFLAARQYNECVKDTPNRRLSALQVRYAAKAAVSQSDASFLRRMFRWGFYERDQQSPKSTLWVVETRMHEHFNALTTQLAVASTDAKKFSVAGRIAAYVQDVTSPVRVVPIYTARFWRFNTNDRFDNYPLADVASLLGREDICSEVLDDSPGAFSEILRETADKSLRAIVEPVPGMPSTWQAFWRLAANSSDFGEYGPAGNRFGNSTSFRCGDERCVLLNKDPLYAEFAAARHVDAVVGTMKVLHIVQQERLASEPAPIETPPSGSEGAAPVDGADGADGADDTDDTEDADRTMARSQARNITANDVTANDVTANDVTANDVTANE